MFQKKIAPGTPVDADLGGPPGVASTPSKPMYDKPPAKRGFQKGGGSKFGGFSKGGGVSNFKGGRR